MPAVRLPPAHDRRARPSCCQTIAGAEGVAARSGAPRSRSRGRPRARRATRCRCWTRRRVLGGRAVDEAVVRSLLGAPQGEIRVEIADVVAVGDVRGAFEVVDRLVQAGHDLRNVTDELLAHFRNLLLVKTAPGQEDLLDIPADAYEALRVQAEKFTPAELSRVLELLLAAQTDMRWTTSPRLTLELALVRACAPETDPTPAGVVARLERLERLANVTAGRRRRPRPDAVPEPVAEPAADAASRPRRRLPTEAGDRSRSSRTLPPPIRSPEAPVAEAGTQLPVPHAADAASVDVAMLRRSWGSLIEHLGQRKPAGPARAPRERHAGVVRRQDARARVPADVQEHASSRSRAARTRSQAGPAGALRDLAGDRLRRARVARRRRRDRTSSRSRKTTRPQTTPRRCGASRRCSAPNPCRRAREA